MADEVQIEREEQEPQQQEEQAFASEGDLARIFTEASSNSPLGEDPNEPTEETPAEETPAPAPTDDPRIAQLLQESQQLRERLAASEARHQVLQSRLNSLPQNQEQEAAPQEFTLESFRELAAKDPTTAIYKLFEDAKAKAGQVGNSAVEQAKAEARATLERQSAYQSDQSTLITEYGELLNGNKDFARLAEQIYSRMTANSPIVSQDPNTGQDVRWHPGAMYAAASMAYAQMHKNGKLQVTNQKVTRLVPRKPSPQNPLVGDQNAETPRTIASDISAKELAIMKRTASQLGMTLEKYLKVYQSQKEQNPYYGTGA